MESLKTSITKTLGYFDLFSCPLTQEELYTYLFAPQEKVSFDTFVRRLDTMQESKEKQFEMCGGYYFFSGREEIIAMRERRVWYIEKKLRIARRAAKIIRSVPFVKAFFVCNQIQIGVTKKSDIDVLIVVEQGKLYSTRLFITFLLSLFRLRRGKKKITDRICLSFYVTDNGLDFSNLKIADPDVYFIHWLTTLIPVYDPQNYLQKIFSQNTWASQHLPHAFQPLSRGKEWKIKDNRLTLFVKKTLEKILKTRMGEKFEIMTKKFQLKHMKGNTESVQNKDSRVVISDTLLKFHENDRRDLFRREWEKKWK